MALFRLQTTSHRPVFRECFWRIEIFLHFYFLSLLLFFCIFIKISNKQTDRPFKKVIIFRDIQTKKQTLHHNKYIIFIIIQCVFKIIVMPTWAIIIVLPLSANHIYRIDWLSIDIFVIHIMTYHDTSWLSFQFRYNNHQYYFHDNSVYFWK